MGVTKKTAKTIIMKRRNLSTSKMKKETEAYIEIIIGSLFLLAAIVGGIIAGTELGIDVPYKYAPDIATSYIMSSILGGLATGLISAHLILGGYLES